MKTSKNKNKKIDYGREPSGFLYWFFKVIIKFILGKYFRVKGTIDPSLVKAERPLIIISNHPSYLDPFLTAAALYPLKVNFLTADNYFRMPFIKGLLYRVGCIPKVQFRPDPTAMKAMFRVIKRDGVLGIFPEGTRSLHGTNMPIEEGFAKFIKKMGANVISSTLNGAYLTWPRWSASGWRRGRIELDIRLALSKEEISDMSIEEIDLKIKDSIGFNDYEFKGKYRSKAPALGLHNVLYVCPKCKAMWTMASEENSLYCTSCGNRAVMDDAGLLHPENDESVVFETPVQWNEWQMEEFRPLVEDPDFLIEDKALMQRSSGNSSFVDQGEGIVRFKHKMFEFVPFENSKEKEPLVFPISGIWGISASYGSYFDLVADKDTYRFFTENGNKILAFSHALDIIRTL